MRAFAESDWRGRPVQDGEWDLEKTRIPWPLSAEKTPSVQRAGELAIAQSKPLNMPQLI